MCDEPAGPTGRAAWWMLPNVDVDDIVHDGTVWVGACPR
jgi:hypothetical protein